MRNEKIRNMIRGKKWKDFFRSIPRPGTIDTKTLTEADKLHDEGDYESSITLLNSDPNVGSDSNALILRSLCLLGLQDFASSKDDLDLAEALLIKRLQGIKINKATLLAQTGQYQIAQKYASEALEIDNQTGTPWALSLGLLCRMGLQEEAISEAKNLVEIWPDWQHDPEFIHYLKEDVDLRPLREHKDFFSVFSELGDSNVV